MRKLSESEKQDLLDGKGVDDLKNKHHCFCMHQRLQVGEEVLYESYPLTLDGEVITGSYIQKDPGYCAECEGTGWCY